MVELNREYLVKKFGSEDRLQQALHIDLYFMYEKINKISLNSFIGLIKAKRLLLEYNEIEEIDGGTFEGLSNITLLSLCKNKLRRIYSLAFEGLVRLEQLLLDRNQITEINESLFKGLSRLKELKLSENKLKRIDSKDFKGLVNLEILHLDKNEIEAIEAGSFEDLSNLKELTLANNEIDIIEACSFDGLSNLKELNLANNKLKHIESNIFKCLTNLKTLRLNNNLLETIEVESFKSLSHLEGLFLNGNKLKVINRKCFESLSIESIEMVRLYDNDSNVFSYFKSTSLDLNKWDNEKSVLNLKGFLSDWNAFLDQFSTSNNEFKTPKMLIVDYYDDLIRDIDIYTEELLEKYSEDDLLAIEAKPKRQKLDFCDVFFKNPYKIEYENDLKINVTQGSTKIHEYLNLVRSMAIEEINKVKEENLQRYEINKDSYKIDRADLTEEKVEEMRKELFKEKFCFQLRIDNIYHEENNNLFKLHTIVTDFYLDQFERNDIKYLNAKSFFCSNNQDAFISHLISNNIYGLCKSNGNEVISITKEALKKIQHIKVHKRKCQGINCKFRLSCGFLDFSQLKSIDIGFQDANYLNKISSLMALGNNLEYLSISKANINDATFKGLKNLVALKLDKLDDYQVNDNPYIHLSNLETLEILSTDYFEIFYKMVGERLKKLCIFFKFLEDTYFLMNKSLPKLEYLNLRGDANFQLLTHDTVNLHLYFQSKDQLKEKTFSKLKSLRSLEISIILPEKKPDLFLGLDNLETLIITQPFYKRVDLKKGDFNGLNNLKTLELNNIKSIDPEVFIQTPMLSDMKMIGIATSCKLDETLLTHLKNLKKIEFSESDLNQIDSNLLDTLRRTNIEIIIN